MGSVFEVGTVKTLIIVILQDQSGLGQKTKVRVGGGNNVIETLSDIKQKQKQQNFTLPKAHEQQEKVESQKKTSFCSL